VDGLAARDQDSIQVLVWNQVYDQYATGACPVRVRVEGLGAVDEIRVTEFRVDLDHSNAHTVWEELGSPDWPDEEQVAAIRARESLEQVEDPRIVHVASGAAEVELTLPVHAVSLLLLEER
jgi:xylan 1,4-beta-xylosidase